MNKNEKKHYLRTIIIFIILSIGLILIYARYVGTKGLYIREYIIENPKLPINFHGLKVVHFTDLHYGSTIFLPELENIVKEINNLNPDIIFFTGDLIDIDYKIKDEEITKIIDILKKLNPQIANYAVSGNHDQGYSSSGGLKKSERASIFSQIMGESNFRILNNEHQLFYYNDLTPILIVGLEDFFVGSQDITKAFEGIEENDYYTILLAHEPDVIKDFENYNIDLFLSGHSHNGQVRLPFIGALVKANKAVLYYDAEYQIDETKMFISGGLGTSKYPLRLFNKPSFNFYRFFVQ